MSAAGRCAAQDKKAASPLTLARLPRSRRGDAPLEGTGPPLRPQGCCAPPAGGGPCGAGLDPGDHCGPSGRKHGQALACPARGAARPVSPYPARKQTPGTRDELAFDLQKRKRNYKNPLTGSVHASRGLPACAEQLTRGFADGLRSPWLGGWDMTPTSASSGLQGSIRCPAGCLDAVNQNISWLIGDLAAIQGGQNRVTMLGRHLMVSLGECLTVLNDESICGCPPARMAAYLLPTREQKALLRMFSMEADHSITWPRATSRAVMTSGGSEVTSALSNR